MGQSETTRCKYYEQGRHIGAFLLPLQSGNYYDSMSFVHGSIPTANTQEQVVKKI